jgi:hypothetical protein
MGRQDLLAGCSGGYSGVMQIDGGRGAIVAARQVRTATGGQR